MTLFCFTHWPGYGSRTLGRSSSIVRDEWPSFGSSAPTAASTDCSRTRTFAMDAAKRELLAGGHADPELDLESFEARQVAVLLRLGWRCRGRQGPEPGPGGGSLS